METPDFKNNWSRWKERIIAEHPNFTDEELDYEVGKEADLILRLKEKTKKTETDIYNWLHLMG